MIVTLLTRPEHLVAMEYNAAFAMLTCHANTDKLENEAPRTFIEKAIKAGHESILEHISLTYSVKDLSRACLQELARHRLLTLSVESTRHTLKKKINDEKWIMNYLNSLDENKRMILQVFLGFAWTNPDMPADELKYHLPEFWPTNLVATANVREWRHIVKLRTAPAALKEFQDLAYCFVNALPNDYQYLLNDCIYKVEAK